MILSRLKGQLKTRYKDEWVDLEPETVSLDLGVLMDPLSLQGLLMVQSVERNPVNFIDDASYFLSFTEACNNKIVNPSSPYLPTSLELAWALVELRRLLPKEEADLINESPMIRKVCMYVLREEGYSEPVWPFDAFLKSEDFYDGQSPQDTANKAKAIRLYIKAVEKTNGEM